MVRSNFWTVDSEDRETTKRNWKRFGSAKFRGQQLLLEDRDNKKEWETISQPENSSCRVFVLRSALGAKFTKKTLHSVISSRLRTKINPKGEKEIR
ncbi:Protein CBG25202 [Caenorhabditis briggsae]|uniref:Protein CBG25202 n=1 Tax=Caenorhabditis briggsae TaxID=6238 RepID=B6IJG1_CAEBR|nr:Protein CBG25202 [Caenorhabditis briggsae]CAS00041.1 Protein CBG25202 [Caenorhabditis briggsae]